MLISYTMMSPNHFEIEYYVTANGKKPILEFLKSLKDKRAEARVRVKLDYLRLGHFGDCRFIADGVHELRIHFGPGYRIYFAMERNKIVLLLWGGKKATQNQDVAKALDYWNDYRRRDVTR